MLRGLASSAALAAAGCLLSACGVPAGLAAAIGLKRPVRLTVCLIGGGLQGKFAGQAKAALGSLLHPAVLQGLTAPLQTALATANRLLTSPVEIDFTTLDSTFQWFQYPTQLYGADSDPAFRVPSPLAMPDIVVATSDQFPDWLAVRAVDLEPYLGGLPQDIPSQVVAQGMAYAHGRGTIQAGLPFLRIPLLCALRPGVQAVHGTKPWSQEEFMATLDALAPDYPPPNAPMPWVPYGMGVPEMAAVGSGALLAQSGSNSAKATFAGRAAGRAMEAIVRWADHRPAEQVYLQWPGDKRLAFGALMFDGQAILGRYGPIHGGVNQPFPVPATWSLAPVPAFAARYAVPVRTVQALVSTDCKVPEQAAALASGLLSAEAQAELLTFEGALALRPAQALRQLGFVAPRAQGAAIIVSPMYDITEADAWGPRTDGNTTVRALARSDLMAALGTLGGSAAYMFNFVRTFNGPMVDLSYVDTSPSSVDTAAPSGAAVSQVLAAAQAAANSGRVYAP